MRLLFAITTILFSLTVLSENHKYYGNDFYLKLNKGDILKSEISQILASYHIPNHQEFDSLQKNCQLEQNPNCYRQIHLTYHDARKFLFGLLYLERSPKGQNFVEGVYCSKKWTSRDFPKGGGIGPDRIPDPKYMNTEHTWPQSRFSKRYEKAHQKSDLHILYPTDSKVNSIRGSFPFAEVESSSKFVCNGAKIGSIRSEKQTYFEPPNKHKGNVARAMFYFSTRYNMPISPTQEKFFRVWNESDPVDESERFRNEKIFEIQRVRNPYIDHPELIKMIEDF